MHNREQTTTSGGTRLAVVLAMAMFVLVVDPDLDILGWFMAHKPTRLQGRRRVDRLRELQQQRM